MKKWPFASWHRLAVRQLGLSPEAFWDMPLSDWLSLIAPERSALTRQTLNHLMQEYPDE